MTQTRLSNEYLELKKDPIPGIVAKPLNGNLFLWGYVLRGAEDTPFDGGIYYGELEFTKDFPYIPPHIRMYTPNGRFNIGERICVSISAFHPENWDPSWTVGTFLNCFSTFMMFDPRMVGKGAMASSVEEKRVFAQQSMSYNMTNKNFLNAFGENPFDPSESKDSSKADVPFGGSLLDRSDSENSNKADVNETDDEEESELSSFSESEEDRFQNLSK